jgi:hypothetical protein
MWKTWLSCLALAIAVVPAQADDKKPTVEKKKKVKVVPGKDFWKILVKPNARWVMKNSDQKSDVVTVETYDVRKVGDADVARLRWMHGKEDIGATESGKPTQVAVTDKGLYLLNAKNDDAVVAKRLAEKPSRSAPPKSYVGTSKNGGRYLQINDEGVVCMGEGPVDRDSQCEDVCDSWICVHPTDGVIELAGLWAPGNNQFDTSK